MFGASQNDVRNKAKELTVRGLGGRAQRAGRRRLLRAAKSHVPGWTGLRRRVGGGACWAVRARSCMER